MDGRNEKIVTIKFCFKASSLQQKH